MGANPIMYVLLDVQRTAAGRPALARVEHFDPSEDGEGSPWWTGPSHRRLPIVDLAAAFGAHLAWLNERRVALAPEGHLTVDGPNETLEDARALKFDLRGSWAAPGHLSVVLHEEDQLPLALAQRAHWAVAAVHWAAPKRNWTLPENDPAHATMLFVLEALQPVSAFVTLDTIGPSEPYEAVVTFPARWATALDSCFLGLERLHGVSTRDPDPGGRARLRHAAQRWSVAHRARRVRSRPARWTGSGRRHAGAAPPGPHPPDAHAASTPALPERRRKDRTATALPPRCQAWARPGPPRFVLASVLSLVVLPSCADRRSTNASTQCEVTVSMQLFRSDQTKIDREVIRRVSRDMRAGREIIWRDAYFHGRRVSRTKVLCLDLPSGSLEFRVLERHTD